jgi:predicted metal-dependent hydrolase
MAPTPMPTLEGLDVGKSVNVDWKTLKPIMEWSSTIIDKAYMMSDFWISKQQKKADAKYAFGKAETEAYKVLQAQKQRPSTGKVGKRSSGNDDVEENAGDFEEWLRNITKEELEEYFEEENKKLDKALAVVKNKWSGKAKEDKEGETATTNKDKKEETTTTEKNKSR